MEEMLYEKDLEGILFDTDLVKRVKKDRRLQEWYYDLVNRELNEIDPLNYYPIFNRLRKENPYIVNPKMLSKLRQIIEDDKLYVVAYCVMDMVASAAAGKPELRGPVIQMLTELALQEDLPQYKREVARKYLEGLIMMLESDLPSIDIRGKGCFKFKKTVGEYIKLYKRGEEKIGEIRKFLKENKTCYVCKKELEKSGVFCPDCEGEIKEEIEKNGPIILFMGDEVHITLETLLKL